MKTKPHLPTPISRANVRQIFGRTLECKVPGFRSVPPAL
jgi:hypothetical protein